MNEGSNNLMFPADNRRNKEGRDRFGSRRDWDNRGYNRRDRGPVTTKSGRVIKGRGVFVIIFNNFL